MWEQRAKTYNSLDWVKDEKLLNEFIAFCGGATSCLDIGCGTGIVTRKLQGEDVMGLDLSTAMLNQAVSENGVKYVCGDAQDLPFPGESFQLITARMMLHHVEDPLKVAGEAYRVLTPSGVFAVCEGVPPDEETTNQYMQIFALKEKRHTFSPELLESILKWVGFRSVTVMLHVMPQVSLKNWLRDTDAAKTQQILRLHLDADDHFKQVYNMTVTRDDILIDWKFAFIKGEK